MKSMNEFQSVLVIAGLILAAFTFPGYDAPPVIDLVRQYAQDIVGGDPTGESVWLANPDADRGSRTSPMLPTGAPSQMRASW